MPIKIIPCTTALENQKRDALSGWPQRVRDENRIEPLAQPGFSPSFRIAPGASVFTIGSCFARVVEEALETRGFVVPTRRFWSVDPSRGSVDNWMLDNYSVAAIYNEIAWALGEEEYDPALHMVEIREGLFADAHLSGRVPLQPFPVAVARRHRIFEITRSMLACDVLVMTLGLAEAWFDRKNGVYLNTRPLRGTLVVDPDRFELHVLSYEDAVGFLRKTFDLVLRRCDPKLRVILTVSPVPMSVTFTGQDVAVANVYSKSVLRAVAGEIAEIYDQIDYFPSYEAVVLSNRQRAYEDDQVHVRRELIDRNISAMLRAYTDEQFERAPDFEATFSTGETNADLARARAYLQAGNLDKALAAATLAFDTPAHAVALTVVAQVALRRGDLAAAETALAASLALRTNLSAAYGLLGLVRSRQRRHAEAVQHFEQALAYAPTAAFWSAQLSASLLDLGELVLAERAVLEALRLNPGHPALERAQAAVRARCAAAPPGSHKPV